MKLKFLIIIFPLLFLSGCNSYYLIENNNINDSILSYNYTWSSEKINSTIANISITNTYVNKSSYNVSYNNTQLETYLNNLTAFQTYGDYNFEGGSGDRTNIIKVSHSGIAGGYDVTKWVDGDFGQNSNEAAALTTRASKGEWIEFSFPLNSEKYISEITWYQGSGGVHTHGYWIIQGARTDNIYINISEPFILGGSTEQKIPVNQREMSFSKYRFLGINGTASGSPWVPEIEFRIASASADGLRGRDIFYNFNDEMIDKLSRAFFFDEIKQNGNIQDKISGEVINVYDGVNSQDITPIAQGIKMKDGVIRIPSTNNLRGQTIAYRIPVDKMNGFLIESPNGNGFLNSDPDGSADVEKLMMGKSFRDMRERFEDTVASGNWGVYHREREHTITTTMAVGGRYSSDNYRVDEMDLAFLIIWNDELNSSELQILEDWSRDYMLQRGVTMHYEDALEEKDLYIGIGDSMMEGVDLVSNIPSEYSSFYELDVDVLSIEAGGTHTSPYDYSTFNLYGSGHAENPSKTMANTKVSPAFGLALESQRRDAYEKEVVILNFGKGSSYIAPRNVTGGNPVLSWNTQNPRTLRSLYQSSLNRIEEKIGDLAQEGYRPTDDTIYFMWSFGLNGAVSTAKAPSPAQYESWLQDLLDNLESDLAPFEIKVLFMRAHEDDPVSDASALQNVINGTNNFINNNSNVYLLANDGYSYIDGVHNNASRMIEQGQEWHNLKYE